MIGITIVKAVAGTVISTGVGAIAKNAVKSVTPDNISKATKVVIAIGGAALSWYTAKKIVDEVEETIDDLVDLLPKKEETEE